MIIRGKDFDFKNNTYIMGILNFTPDSFSDGGKFFDMDKALYHVEDMINSGADIIDISGQSTRPGYKQISINQEIERVYPIISAVRERFDVPISLDSYKSEVIEANIDHIDLINDVSGLKYDDQMINTVARSGLPYCLMHNKVTTDYRDFFSEFLEDIKQDITAIKRAGIDESKVIIDGGVGFGKSYEQNLIVINKTEQLCALGYPVMIAVSRKSCIGLTLENKVDERLIGTIVVTVVGVMKGASIIRVHDVGENVDAIKMTKSILGERKWVK